MKKRAAITGVGGYVPPQVITNFDLEKVLDTSDAWIRERTGIETRHRLADGLGSSDMGVEASRRLFERHQIDPMSIDLVICATVTADQPLPCNANFITAKLGAKNAWGFDLVAACSGFLYALAVGAQFIESGMCKRVLVVGTDKMSAIIDPQDRATAIIFGDGAGAVLLEPTEDGLGIQDFVLYSDGEGAQFLNIKAGGCKRPASHETVSNREHYVYQEGQTVFKRAVIGMAEAAAEIMQRNQLTADDIRFLVPHQANKRIIDATANRMGIGEDKVMLNIQKYANTTAGTLPLCLWDYESQLKPGDNLILASFGGGFTWGALWLKWAYHPKL